MPELPPLLRTIQKNQRLADAKKRFMVDVSAALVLLAGCILMAAGSVATSLTDGSRQRFVGFGIMLSALGFLVWMATIVQAFVR